MNTIWVGPWEKVSQNIDPSENNFFVTNYQHWTGTSALKPFLAPLPPGGAWGAPEGFWGVCRAPNFHYLSETNFKPGMHCFG